MPDLLEPSSGPVTSNGSRRVRRAVFVDRDGTLNPDLRYLSDSSRLELFPTVPVGIRLLKEHGYVVVCITNQSGIERGYYTVEIVEAIHRRVNELLARHGTGIDAFYYCPHRPDAGCACRKPKTQLFERAATDLGLGWNASAVIGDRSLDMEAGETLGLLTALVRPPGHERDLENELRERGIVPDLKSDHFLGAVRRILARG